MNVSFTGTQRGMTERQRWPLSRLLEELLLEEGDEFHYGACVGADDLAAKHAEMIGFRVVAHPANDVRPELRAEPRGRVLPARPAKERNKDIVTAGDVLIATPRLMKEERRSGTWATVRYARRLGGRRIVILWPDGSREEER